MPPAKGAADGDAAQADAGCCVSLLSLVLSTLFGSSSSQPSQPAVVSVGDSVSTQPQPQPQPQQPQAPVYPPQPAPSKPTHQEQPSKPQPSKPQHHEQPSKPQHHEQPGKPQPHPAKPTHEEQPSKPHPSKPHPSKPHSPPPQHGEHHEDDEALVAQAEELRDKARELADKRSAAYDASQDAWNSGDKAGAKELSDKAKKLGAQMEELNEKASQLFYEAKNKGRGLGELDLHGQFVHEAVELADKRIAECRAAEVPELVLIVGKGLHSVGGKAKVKPAIIELLKKHRIDADVGEPNEGCVTVHLDAVKRGRSRGIGEPTEDRESSIVDKCKIQ
ncbi:hypothetical protein HK105_208739 [Polyrhizophydium stewartii]|uniref:Smr domain-containing protein n=1 Tax=Polyrhizophydium stewartii TaxID=2732419 RepID=A0ABR4MX61_9FUNG